ncbi:F-box domain-containing protein [Phaeosphaeriaceae sp. PMI808]|nr:F-box domain-containing protein [Phaeosphaeriaceae sp. PMI808]
MDTIEFSKEDLLSHLSHRPRYILTANISVDESVKLSLSKIQREPQLSVGLLDDLPLELLHDILNYLDLQSLSQFSRVSLRGRVIAESLPAYRDLTSAAGHIFQTLSRTRVIGLHSVAALQTALRSNRCISCGQYGAFLFLLSSERCCFACLSFNQSLWLIPLPFARACFGLTRQQSKALPTMRSIPGTYFVRRSISRLRPTTLTSARAAKELAIKVHGSTDAIARILATKHLRTTIPKPYTGIWYQNAPLQPFSQDILTLKSIGSVPNDEFGGTGSVTFPSMVGNVVESGLWCRGCERTFELYRFQKLDRDVVSRLAPLGCDAFRFIKGLQYRARSEAEFLEHAQHCYSATEVMTKRWVGLL